MLSRYTAQFLCAALLAVATQQANAEADPKNQWRIGLGVMDLHYNVGEAAEVWPDHQPAVEIGWTRQLSGPWSVRANFLHAPSKHRQTHQIVSMDHTEDNDNSAKYSLFQVGVGYTLTEAHWGKLTVFGMLTHARATFQFTEIETIGGTTRPPRKGEGQINKNRLMLGLEYQLPGIDTLGGALPYVQVQSLISSSALGGNHTVVSAGLVKSF